MEDNRKNNRGDDKHYEDKGYFTYVSPSQKAEPGRELPSRAIFENHIGNSTVNRHSAECNNRCGKLSKLDLKKTIDKTAGCAYKEG